MSDIVNAFKQTKGYKKRKNLLSDTQEVAQQPQEQESQNQALNASQQQNIALDTSGTKDSDRLAQLQQLAAAETAQNEANRQAAAQANAQAQQQANSTQQLSKEAQNVYNNAHNDNGWKKYYNEEKQKVRDSAFKNDGLGSWLQDVFNAGWDSRLAEQQARNRYASEMVNNAWDNNGNVKDQNAVYQAQGTAAYNVDRGRQLNEIERANSRALGASYDSDFNQLESTANAIRRMDLGNALLQGDESDTAGVSKFLINLIPGMLSAPISGTANISEAISGKGLDSETGRKKDLDGLERIGRGLSGAIDAAGVFYGGSGEAISSISKQIFNRGATNVAKNVAKQTSKQVMKDFAKAMLKEGTEEAVQQAFEFFGDGGKIITEDGEFDGEAFNDLAQQVAQAGALGAVGGGTFHGLSLGTDAIGSNLNNRKIKAQNNNAETSQNENANPDTNTNQDLNVGNTDYDENTGDTNQNIEQQAKDVSTETNTTITPAEMTQNADASARVVEKSDTLRNILNDSQKQAFNDRVKDIRSDLEQNRISYTEYLQKVEALQNEFTQRVEGAEVQQQEQSATGQQVNPEDVSRVVTEAQGTQASETPAFQETPAQQFTQTEQSQEGMIQRSGEDPIENNAFELGQKNLNEGVELAEEFASDPAGYEQAAIDEGIPIAYDYKTGEPLYFLSDVYAALDQNNGTDVNGVQVETPSMAQARRADTQAQQRWESLKNWNDDLKEQRQAGLISQYEYENRLDLPRSREEMQALGKYFDDNYVKSLGITGNYDGDASVIPPIWGNRYRGEALVATPETQINELIENARNEAPEPIPMEAYGVEPTALDNNVSTPTPLQEVEIAFRDYENSLRETGMTEELWRKIANARVESGRNSKNGEVNVDLNKVLTPEEQAIAKQYFKVKAGGDTALAKEMYDSAYLTIQESGTDYVGRAKEELINSGVFDDIYHNTKYVIGGDEADPFLADADYMLRKLKPDLYTKMASYDEAVDIAPDATPEQAKAYAEKAVEVYNQLNQKADSTVKEKTTISDIRSMKPADGFSEMGNALGIKKVKDITSLNALQKAGVNFGKGSSDFQISQATNNYSEGLKLQLWDNSEAYVRTMNNEQVANMIRSEVPLSKAQEQSVFDNQEMNRIYNRTLEFTGSKKAAEMAVNRLMLNKAIEYHTKNTLTKTEYTDPSMRKWVNHIASEVLVGRRVQATAGQELGAALQRAMNSSFRGARWNTTLNEFAEMSKNFADYGGLKLVKPSEWGYYKSKYGFGDNGDISKLLPEDQRVAFEENMKNAKTINDQLTVFKAYSKFMDGVDKLTQWNAYVQDLKDATYLRTAEEYYSSQKYADDMNRMLAKQNKPQTARPLEGAGLINAVRKDFGERMLPMDRFYKMIKTDRGITKPLLMYLDSSTRMTMQTGKAAIGLNTAGKNASRGIGTRIIANQADFVPRIVYALVRGIPLVAVFNLPQIDDYSGIQEEDKNALDEIVRYSSALSPLLSLFSYGYNQYRQDEIAEDKDQNTGENLKGDWINRTKDNTLKTLTPLGGWLDQTAGLFGNLNNSIGVAQRGYGENKNGRVQYLAPDNPVDWVRGLIEGMSGTSNAREYNKNPDLLSALINQAMGGRDYNGDGIIDGGINDFVRYNRALNEFPVDLGLKDENDYNRPLNQYENSNYSGKVQEAARKHDMKTAQEWYEKGRAYNALLDNLRVKNPDAVDVYYSSMGNNLVDPEKWKTVLYGQNPNGEPDLTVWNLMKDMALKRHEDFDTPVDPAYNKLNDEQTRRYLQYKSTATGEDTALKKIMTQDPFWKDFFNKQKEYYDSLPEYEYDDSNKTTRVQDWNDLNDQYSDYMSFISGNLDGMNDQQLGLELSLQFPLMAEYQSLKTELQDKYGDEYKNSREYKNFWSQNYDAYSAESDAFNEQMLGIINQMRRIEGYGDMTLEELETINSIGKESKSSSKSGGYSRRSSGGGSSSSGGYSYAPYFENTFQAAPVYAKVPNAGKIKYNTAGKANLANVPISSSKGGQPYATV